MLHMSTKQVQTQQVHNRIQNQDPFLHNYNFLKNSKTKSAAPPFGITDHRENEQEVKR